MILDDPRFSFSCSWHFMTFYDYNNWFMTRFPNKSTNNDSLQTFVGPAFLLDDLHLQSSLFCLGREVDHDTEVSVENIPRVSIRKWGIWSKSHDWKILKYTKIWSKWSGRKKLGRIWTRSSNTLQVGIPHCNDPLMWTYADKLGWKQAAKMGCTHQCNNIDMEKGPYL